MAINDTISSILLVYQLEQEPRAGYVKRGVLFNEKDCESVAEHTATGAILSHILALEYAPNLDTARISLLFLFHDLPEAITKDKRPEETSPTEKKELERKAYDKIIRPFSNMAREKLDLIHEEYVANQTPEAQFTHDIDVFQRCIRAGIYFKEHPEITRMKEFFPETKLINNPKLQKLCEKTLDYLAGH